MNLKVISLNMWWGGELFSALLEFLRREDADIVMLQEVYDGTDPSLKPSYRSMRVLDKELGYPYAEFGLAYIETAPAGKIPHGNAILSKFAVKDSETLFMANPPRPDFEYRDTREHWPILPAPLQIANLETPAGSVAVGNVHGVWDLDGDNYSQNRQAMTSMILELAARQPNVIVAGDTNAKSTNRAMLELEPRLKSVFGAEVPTTFNMRRKDNPGYATAAVDLMFVSSKIEVISKHVPDVDISDHLPLVVTLQIP